MPAHATSAGKAMLAVLANDEVLASRPSEKLATVTEDTLAARTQLLAELARVRAARICGHLRGERDRSGRGRHGGA
jgi:DNA-binding IclR family transcriptional regulator